MTAVAEAPIRTIRDVDADMERLRKERQTLLPSLERGMKRFRLLSGVHYQNEVVGKNPDGSPKIEIRGYAVLYPNREAAAKGVGPYFPIVKSNQDLVKIHNKFGYAPRWAEVQEGEEDIPPGFVDLGPVVAAARSKEEPSYIPGAVPPGVAGGAPMPAPPTGPINDALEEMSDKELRQVAADEEIDVSKCKSKAEVIKMIRTVVQAATIKK